MSIAVLNSGSSSIKFSVFEAGAAGEVPKLLLDGELSGVGGAGATLAVTRAGAARGDKPVEGAETVAGAIDRVMEAVAGSGTGDVESVGYRVVHPGPKLGEHVRITEAVMRELAAAASFAPLHDPEALEIIRAGWKRFPEAGHFACFDTAFHRTMPEAATTYAIPEKYRAQGVRRYGFHGLSCESVVRQMQAMGPLPRRMVIAHLGGGSSVTALVDGKSVDTTMGLTPTGGVVMATRPGDLDPGLVVYLMRQERDVKAAEKMLNHEAGMVALTKSGNDMKALRKAVAEGNERARLAVEIFTRSVRQAMGGFAWLMGGLDAVVFTGGIGEHDGATRAEVLAGLGAMGIALDSLRNEAKSDGPRTIHASDSLTAVYAVPSQEDFVIALHVKRMEAFQPTEAQ